MKGHGPLQNPKPVIRRACLDNMMIKLTSSNIGACQETHLFFFQVLLSLLYYL